MSEGLRNILMPLSALYGGIVSTRNFGYDKGLFKVSRLPIPVVSVGNISVGGSGKTPFVMFLIEKFLALGKKPAVLSRGYKRLANDLVVSCPGRGGEADVQMLGDEPALISMSFPEVPVGVYADRYRAGLAVLKKYCADVFILDDGLQNRELHRDLDFVLIRQSLHDLRDWYLPAGNLRDSKRRFREADVLVLTSHAAFSAEGDSQRLLGKYSGAPIAGVSYVAADLSDHTGTRHPFEILRGREVVAFCGIANHDQFFDCVNTLGGNVVARKSFRDHHWYDEYDIDEIFGGNEDSVAVTTSKDAVRIFHDEELSQLDDVRRIYAVNEKAVINFGEEHIDSAVKGIFEDIYA